MFGRPPQDIHSLLGNRSSDCYPHTRLPPLEPPRDHHATYYHRVPRRTHPQSYKTTCQDDLDAPPGSEFSSVPEDAERYAFHTDNDRDKRRLPSCSLQGQYSTSPGLRSVSVRVHAELAEHLRPNEMLILPELTHLNVRLISAHTLSEQVLHAAVGSEMRLGDVIKQIVHSHYDERIRSSDVTAKVKQRGRWDEPSPSTKLEELVHRGDTFKAERREMEVKIFVSGEKRERARSRGSGWAPRGGLGANVGRAWERKSRGTVDV